MDLVLYKQRLLEVGLISQEVKVDGGVIVELAWIGNVVAQVFVQKRVVGLETELPLVPAMDDRSCAFEVCLAKGILLENLDGSRFRVGVEIIGIVPAHGPKISRRIGRKSVLVGSDCHRFHVIGGLALARGLL